jgi:UDP-2,3-diacylglucosamine pyrophosphatase LpxH
MGEPAVHEGRLLAISDVHLDLWWDRGGTADDRKKQAFLEFLEWVRYDSGCQHFAIVGDLLDVPQSDHSPILPRFREVFVHLWGLMRSGIRVHWVVGNHDGGLMGLDVAMVQPPVQIAYPAVSLRSGGRDFWIEHGHGMDAWLWAYVQYRASRVAAVDPARAMAHFAHCSDVLPPPTPAMDFVYDTIYEAMQWRAMESGFSEDEQRLGIEVMSQHLTDDFADVSDDGQLPKCHEQVLRTVAELGLTVQDLRTGVPLPAEALGLFMSVGARYYSALPWRRAARCRLRHLRQAHGREMRGLIMGHIHEADRYEWDCDGDRVVYANCGTWREESGSFVLLDDGELTAYSRRWDDPLPQLP